MIRVRLLDSAEAAHLCLLRMLKRREQKAVEDPSLLKRERKKVFH
jgi:hypothetical protein